MDDQSMTRTECLALLRTASVGRVAYSERALPAIATVPFAVIGDLIAVHAAGATSPAAAWRESIVAFQVEQDDWNVTCVGRATVLDDGLRLAASEALGSPLDGDYVGIATELLRGTRGLQPGLIQAAARAS